MRIEAWAIVGDTCVYTPPEVKFLTGKVFGSPNHPDGTRITTSEIVSHRDGLVTTASGSVYELGEPCQSFVDWCRKNNVHVPTREQPIKS